jgi:hypothetical protein
LYDYRRHVPFRYPSTPIVENFVARSGLVKMFAAPIALAPILVAIAERQGLSALFIVLACGFLLATPLVVYMARYKAAVGEDWFAQRGIFGWNVVDLTCLTEVRGRNRNAQRLALRDAQGHRAVL